MGLVHNLQARHVMARSQNVRGDASEARSSMRLSGRAHALRVEEAARRVPDAPAVGLVRIVFLLARVRDSVRHDPQWRARGGPALLVRRQVRCVGLDLRGCHVRHRHLRAFRCRVRDGVLRLRFDDATLRVEALRRRGEQPVTRVHGP